MIGMPYWRLVSMHLMLIAKFSSSIKFCAINRNPFESMPFWKVGVNSHLPAPQIDTIMEPNENWEIILSISWNCSNKIFVVRRSWYICTALLYYVRFQVFALWRLSFRAWQCCFPQMVDTEAIAISHGMVSAHIKFLNFLPIYGIGKSTFDNFLEISFNNKTNLISLSHRRLSYWCT